MSSTNRSTCKNRHLNDYYITPIDSIVNFLTKFNEVEKDILFKDLNILDCCAGGLINKDKMSYPESLQQINNKLSIDTIDIRKDSLANIKADYLETDCSNKYDMIITNPPFNISLQIIEKSLKDVKVNGFVIMLLRLNYFGSKLRQEFWENNMPKYSFIHNKRMSFTGKGTDSIEYMHCVWNKNNKNNEYVKTYLLKEY